MRISFRPHSFCMLAILLAATPLRSTAQLFVEKGNTVTYRGNSFELSAPHKQTRYAIDPIDGRKTKLQATVYKPAKMNSRPIYSPAIATTSPSRAVVAFEEYLLRGLTEYFLQVGNGSFRVDMNEVIADEQGHVVYYNFGGVQGIPAGGDNTPRKYSPPNMNSLDSLIVNAPALSPAKLDGKNVLAYTGVNLSEYRIDVTNGSVTFTQDGKSLDKTIDFARAAPLK